MKRILAWLLIIALCFAMAPASAFADNEGTLILPGATKTVAEEAFYGDSSFNTLVIPKSVESIGPQAFASCSNLREVYLGKNTTIRIARDAFQDCTDLHFYVYPHTSGELYARMHGFRVDYLEEGSTFLDRAMALVAENGGSTVLQSGQFASKRLIVCRSNDTLPDISGFEPTDIIYDDDVYVVQFSSVDNTSDCYTLLANDPQTVFVEADESVEAIEGVQAQGVVDSRTWGTDDPMGFDAYSQFVADNGSGSACIAVIDSGVSILASYRDKLRSDGINMLYAQDGQDWSTDYNRHGSVIASVISDCAGGANVSILPVRVVGASGNTDFILLGNGIKYAVSHGANIINMSMNFKESAYVTHCIDEAVNSGVTVVVAAGNSHRNISSVYPAKLSNVITVSGLSSNYQLSPDSNFGIGVSYSAPDSYVKVSAYANSLFNGTSFAAPMIASALALLQMDPYHTIDDLNASCYLSNDTDSPPNSYGYGMPQLNEMAYIHPSTIEFGSNLPVKMAVNDITPVNWILSPENTTNKAVQVTSSDETVLEVQTSDTGDVSIKAISVGTATISLTAVDNGISVSRNVTVVQPVTSIEIQGAEDTLPLQRTMRLAAVISPDNATNPEIEWVSNNPEIATVTRDGLVKPVAVGEVGIYAKATDDSGAQSNVVYIEVIEQPNAESIRIEIGEEDFTGATYTMQPGDAIQLNTRVLPEDADQSVTYIAGGDYFTVSDTGVVTAREKGNGASAIVLTSDGKVRASITIEVVVRPTSVSISGDTSVVDGNSITLTANVLPENANDRSVTWTSSNENVATVINGVVTGIAPGSTIIRATSNADNTLYSEHVIEVKHPGTIIFDLNAEDDQTAVASMTSKVINSGDTLGELPSATRAYYTLDGWYSAKNGGIRYNRDSVMSFTSDSVTLFAHWKLNELSEWVLPSEVPSNGTIIETSYSFRESTESTNSYLDGWVANGDYWKQTGTASVNYASFPGGFNQSHSIYTSFAKSAFSGFENNSSKRVVSNAWAGYVYWHWMYDCGGSNGTSTRAIYNWNDYGPDNGYLYQYFGAFTSTNGNYSSDTWYCNSQGIQNFIIPERTAYADCQGATRWFRFDYYRSTYTDYDKYYKYYRDVEYQVTDPGNGSNISQKVTYVKYRMKYGAVSDWSETKPVGIDDKLIETKTQYSYSDKSFTTGTTDTMDGWTLYDTQQVWGNYGAWSGWTSTPVSASDSTKVETRSAYHYYYYVCSNCGAHMHGYGTCYTWAGGCGSSSISSGSYHQVWETTPYSSSGDFCGTGVNYINSPSGNGRVFAYINSGSQHYVAPQTQYRYCTRTQSTVYYFYQWGNWSAWSDSVYTETDNRKVNTRTLYRYVVENA